MNTSAWPCHTLIQNVSDQCIPNLVALRTFRPRRVVWVYTAQVKEPWKRLKAMVLPEVEQCDWLVDARDVEALHRTLDERFALLGDEAAPLVYHLTGGTKSMSLQGLFHLGSHRRRRKVQVQGVVMNPKTQGFDVLYPEARNHALACASLKLDQILRVHGNAVEQPGRDLGFLRARLDVFEELRALAPRVLQALGGREIGKTQHDGWIELKNGTDIPPVVQKALHLLCDGGLVQKMRIEGNRVQVLGAKIDTHNVFAYVRDIWMEDWIGAVLATHLDDWQGGYSGVKVRFGRRRATGQDMQEFDFLGARRNHLVYWSCKRVKEIKASMLFEVDALRDEVGGRDHHIAGLAYMGECGEGMRQKARRLGVRLLDVSRKDAAQALLSHH